MRNWNPDEPFEASYWCSGFKPTYEELKPERFWLYLYLCLSFKPTYEELKQETQAHVLAWTYEF